MSVLDPTNAEKWEAVECSVRNKFQWSWLEKTASLGGQTYTWNECIRKLDVPGRAKCIWCDEVLDYGGTGRKAIIAHMDTKKHISNGLALREKQEDNNTSATDSYGPPKVTKNIDYDVLSPDKDGARFTEVDRKAKVKFQLSWWQKIGQAGDYKYRFKDCIQKVSKPGHALCTWCDMLINYGSGGSERLVGHINSLKHVTRAMTILGQGKGDAEEEQGLRVDDEVEQAVYSVQLGHGDGVPPTEVGSQDNSEGPVELESQQIILTRKDDFDLKALEKNVNKKFHFEWLTNMATMELKYSYSDCLKKVDIPGKVMCIWCDMLLSYGNKGSAALRDHLTTIRHMNNASDIFRAKSMTAAGWAQKTDKQDPRLEPDEEDESTTKVANGNAEPPTVRMNDTPQADVAASDCCDAGDAPRDGSLQMEGEEEEATGITGGEDNPYVVEETVVKEYYKIIKCQEYVVKKRDKRTGKIIRVSTQQKEEAPLTTNQRIVSHPAGGTGLRTQDAVKRPSSTLDAGSSKRQRVGQTTPGSSTSVEQTERTVPEVDMVSDQSHQSQDIVEYMDSALDGEG